MNDTIQPSMLDTLPAYTVKDVVPRKAQRDRAESHADPLVMERYERVVMLVGKVRRRFIAAEVTKTFEDRYSKLSLSDSRGLGGLYARMLKQGVIVKTNDFKARLNGCPQRVYEWRG